MTPRVTELGNGLAVASLAMPGAVSASVGLFADVGARHEAAASNGLAHFLEHMVFKGAGGRDARGLSEAIEDVGGQLNAWTGRDATAFHARVLPGDLPLAVGLLGDMITAPWFRDADIATEREVVLSELAEARDTPDDLVWDHAQALAFPDQPMGRPILGAEATLAAITADDLRGWIARHYRGGACVLAATGAVEHDALAALAERAFGALPPGGPAAPEPARFGGGATRDRRRRAEATQMVLAFEGPGLHASGHQAAQLFATAVGGGASSRLFVQLREERGLAYSVGASHSGYADSGLFTVSLATQPRDASRALSLARDVLREGAAGLTAAELARAKAQLKAGLLMAMEDSAGLMQWMGSRWLTHRRFLSAAEIAAQVDAVTLEETRAVAAAMLAGPVADARIGP